MGIKNEMLKNIPIKSRIKILEIGIENHMQRNVYIKSRIKNVLTKIQIKNKLKRGAFLAKELLYSQFGQS